MVVWSFSVSRSVIFEFLLFYFIVVILWRGSFILKIGQALLSAISLASVYVVEV